MEVDESVGRATVNVIRTGDPAQTFVLKYQTVEARSTVGQGTTFTLTIPAREKLDTETPASTAPKPGKLVLFPGIPPHLKGQTGTYGP